MGGMSEKYSCWTFTQLIPHFSKSPWKLRGTKKAWNTLAQIPSDCNVQLEL